MIRPLLPLALGLAIVASSGANARGTFVLGRGANDCGAFLEAESEERTAYLAFAEGYLSGLNGATAISSERTADNLAPEGFGEAERAGFLDSYCRKHRDETFELAVRKLFFGIRRAARGLPPEID